MARLMGDESHAGTGIHDDHGKLRRATVDAVEVGDLRPGVRSEQFVQPPQRIYRAVDRNAVAPRRLFTGQVENPNHYIVEPSLFVNVVGIDGPGEVMDVLGVEPNALSPGPTYAAPSLLPTPSSPGGREEGGIPLPLVVDAQVRIGRRPFPPWIAFNRHARRPNNLIFRQVERHIVRRELAVELARRQERPILPPVPVVHHHSRVPLRKVVPATTTPLSPRYGTEPGEPRDLHRRRISGRQRLRQGETHDGRVGSVRIFWCHRCAVDDTPLDPLERERGIGQVVEPSPSLDAVPIGPPRTGTKGVQVKMKVEVRQDLG